MSNGPPWCDEIKKLAGNRNVVLVEGRLDQYVIERWLDLHGIGRPLVFAVGPRPPADEAGGYHRVIQGLNYFTRQRADGLIDPAVTWWGLVDRDERDDDTIAADQGNLPTLRALARNCLECYFIQPDELWSYLPTHQQERFAEGKAAIERELYSVLDHWVTAWCMWRVVRMRQYGLHAVLGFPQRLVDILKARPDLSEAEIKSELKIWHDHLEPDAVYAQFADLRNDSLRLSAPEKLMRHVDGKSMFNEVVVARILRSLISNREAAEWVKTLVAGMTGPPAEMAQILAVFMPQQTPNDGSAG